MKAKQERNLIIKKKQKKTMHSRINMESSRRDYFIYIVADLGLSKK